jgi:hypothetical protein
MDFFILFGLCALGLHFIRSRDQRSRIVLLGTHLGKYQVEKHMESLTGGYLRALGENEAARRDQIFQLLETTETQLVNQFNNFTADFSKVNVVEARVSKFPMAIPYAARLFPASTFDLRQAFLIHAQGITEVAANRSGRSARDKAFTLSAELFLMQHSCHWFCKSKNVASARLLLRHQTAYEQLLASVSPETRRAYVELTRE